MRRLRYTMCSALLVAALSVCLFVRPVQAQAALAEEPVVSTVATYSISVLTELPEGCAFHFFDGDMQVKEAAQGAMIRVEVVLPKPNQAQWRLLTNALAYYTIVDGEMGVRTPILNGQFRMPNKDVTVEGTLVKGFTIQNNKYSYGLIKLERLDGYQANDEVVFETVPDEGSVFESVKITRLSNGESVEYQPVSQISTGRYKFRMPEDDVQIVSSFKQKEFAISLQVEVDDRGKASTLQFSKQEGLHYKEVVTVTPKPAHQYRVKPGSLKKRLKSHQTSEVFAPDYDETSGRPFSFEMDSEDIEVFVAFERDPSSFAEVELLVQQFVDPTPANEVRNEVKVYYVKSHSVVKPKSKVKEGDELLIRCRPAAGYYVHAVQLHGKTYSKQDSVVFVVPDVESLNVNVYFRKEKLDKPNPNPNTPTSVESMPHVEVYPNPFGDELRVVAEDVDILELYSIDGKMLHSQPYGDGRMQVSGLPEGVYVLQVHFRDGGVVSHQVVR